MAVLVVVANGKWRGSGKEATDYWWHYGLIKASYAIVVQWYATRMYHISGRGNFVLICVGCVFG